MTPEAALIELLERVGAGQDAAVRVTDHELNQWPTEAVKAMQSQKLLAKTRPATSAICPGCERDCVMPIHTVRGTSGDSAPFIVCGKRDDINRVSVPISRLEQWQTSGTLVADFLSEWLELRRPDTDNALAGRWEIGMLKGKKHSRHLVLLASDNLNLTLAGHSLPLTDVLEIKNNQLTINKRCMDSTNLPKVGGC